MSSMWVLLYAVVTVLCSNRQLEMVSAEQGDIKPKNVKHGNLNDWKETSGTHETNNVDAWILSSESPVLETTLGTAIPPNSNPAQSWFITPLLNPRPPTSSLQIEARCSSKTSCEIEIYGTNESSSFVEVDTMAKFERNFKSVVQNDETMKFGVGKKELKTAILSKSFSRLGILVRAKQNVKWTIYAIKIYYYYCDGKTVNSTLFRRENAFTTDRKITAYCVPNAVSNRDETSKSVFVWCSPKGIWTFTGEQCVCVPAFGLNESNCSRCNVDYYKDEFSNTKCSRCPLGKTNDRTNTGCQCKENRYISSDGSGNCYAVPPPVSDVTITNDRASVIITWNKQEESITGPITYSLECYFCNTSSDCDNIENETAECFPTKTKLKGTSVNVSGLPLTMKRYMFRIFSQSKLKNFSNWKYEDIYFSPRSDHSTPKVTSTTINTITSVATETSRGETRNIFIYVGVGAAFILIVLLIVIVVVIKLRRSKTSKDGADNQAFEISLPTIGQRTYIDPSNYDDPEAALRDFANEISPKSLLLERVLGGGEFGDVYKGTLRTEGGGVIDIAAKTLKHDSDERSRKDFFMEASAMGQFNDRNVIHLEGVITKSVPHMIVTEYMPNGSLDNFLKQNDENLTDLQLVGMARGVASGMKYLAAMNFVHRDLAARNILVNDTWLCKVADFGLSRELETADSSRGEYHTTGGKIPVRWTAPEAIKYRKFSIASDVWSYGILLWEIMSFAERPYWDWDNYKVLERVDDGYRLTAPKNCPKAVHELMLLCWETDRNERPSFPDIVRMLDDWIRSPETIRYEKIKRPVSSVVISDPSALIKEWLSDIKMTSYIPHFIQAGYNHLSDLAGLSDSDLQLIGVTLVGHRNKMLRTIRSLPITEESKRFAWNRSLKV